MPVAIFYEIVWLDLFPAGTYVPPNGTLSVFLVVCLVYILKLYDYGSLEQPQNLVILPSDVVLPLLLAMPAAEYSSRIESLLRRLNNTRYEALLSHECPRKLVIGSISQAFLLHMASFALCFLVLFFTLWLMQRCLGFFPQNFTFFNENLRHMITWPMLWFAALVGSLLALRIKKAYIAYGAMVFLLFLSFFF